MRQIYAFLLLLTFGSATFADDRELLSHDEHDWLDSLDRPLIVATEKYYHPYNFVDENGDISGVAGDYMRLLQQRLEFEFETREFETFAEVLEAARNREVDIVPLVLDAPERHDYLLFTQPAYETHDHIFVREEFEGPLTLQDMDGMRVGIVAGYARQDEISNDQPGIVSVLVATELEGLRELSLGRIDAYIAEIGTSSYYIEQEGITNLRIAGEAGDVDPQTFASRSDWPMLNVILGKGLASITDEERLEIQRRWINIGGLDAAELADIWKRVGIAAGFVALLLAASLSWSFALRREVAKRTSELKQELAERRILEADKLRLAVAVEQSAEFVLVVDTSANIEFANHSFQEACGEVDIIGRPFDSLAAGTSNNTLLGVLRIVGEKGFWRGQVILSREHGETLKIRMTIAPILDEDSKIDGYVVTGRDVTREEELESRVRRGEKLSALGTLAGGIAHDFNNLLMPILGYTELIRAEELRELDPYVEGIEEASMRARDLAKRIMVFGREGSGEMIPLDLRVEIEDAISFVRSLLPATIKFEDELDDSGTVLGDRTQIQQILMNLCGNASDAMAESGGTLSISLKPESVDESGEPNLPELVPGDYAVLTVTDTGVGMDEKTRARIFDPYFSAKRRTNGAGLGLSIVHGIVERHGGIIHARSELNKGTTFRVFLPAVALPATPQAEEDDIDVPRGNGETIMLVDDDDLVLSTIARMLHGLGYDVSAWIDPAEALEAFAESPAAFDAILTDFTMPYLTGSQLANKAQGIRADIPVAIMTGNTGALKNYDRTCIAKPMQMSELARCVRELLD